MDMPDHALEPETDPGVDGDTGEPVDDIGEESESVEVEVLALSEILPFSQYRISLAEGERPPSDRVQFAMDCADRRGRASGADPAKRPAGLSAYKGPGGAVSWVGSGPHRTTWPLFTGRHRRLSGRGRALRLVVLPPAPVDRPDAGLAAMFTRFPDIAESIPAANCVAVNPQQSARYSPRACQVFFDLGMIPPRSRLRVASESSPLRSPLSGRHSLLLSTKSHLLSSPFVPTDGQSQPVFKILDRDINLLALPGRVRGAVDLEGRNRVQCDPGGIGARGSSVHGAAPICRARCRPKMFRTALL